MTARFVMSATEWDGLDDLGLPEVAFAGRSNVGKSSLLGAVMGHAKLVRVSRTPGRTQTLNLFVYDDSLAMLDLPGYGFAKVSKGQKVALDRMVQTYLERREALRGVVVLVDMRRDPVSPYDAHLVQWLLQAGRNTLIVGTKADAIGKNQRRERLRSIDVQLGVPLGTTMAVSARSGDGIEALRRQVWQLKESA